MARSTLLAVDAFINLLLGVSLAFFPHRVLSSLGLPDAGTGFYPSILGAVLIGIGAALLVGRTGEARGSGGLGTRGALIINLVAAICLAIWLIAGELKMPPRGAALLWILVFVLIVLSMLELTSSWRGSKS